MYDGASYRLSEMEMTKVCAYSGWHTFWVNGFDLRIDVWICLHVVVFLGRFIAFEHAYVCEARSWAQRHFQVAKHPLPIKNVALLQ